MVSSGCFITAKHCRWSLIKIFTHDKEIKVIQTKLEERARLNLGFFVIEIVGERH